MHIQTHNKVACTYKRLPYDEQVQKAWEDAYHACTEIMQPALVREHKLLSDFKSTDYMRPEKPHVD